MRSADHSELFAEYHRRAAESADLQERLRDMDAIFSNEPNPHAWTMADERVATRLRSRIEEIERDPPAR